MNIFRDLWRVSPSQSILSTLLVLLSGLGTVLAAPLAARILVHHSAHDFTLLALSLLLATSSQLALRLLLASLSGSWAQSMRLRLMRISFLQDLPTLENTPVGELLDRIDDDAHQVGTALRESASRFAVGLSTALFGIVVAFVVWPPAGVAFTLTALLFVLLIRPRARTIAPARTKEEEAWSDLAAVMEEAVHGQDDIRTALAQPYVLRSYARRAAIVLQRGIVAWTLTARLNGLCVLVMRSMLALLALGGTTLVFSHHLDLARLTSTWFLALSFGLNVEFLSRQFPEIQQALGSWTRIQLLLASPQEDPSGLPAREGAIEVRDLTFSYSSRPVLSHVRLTFHPGRSYALVGRTGSGKSTLAKILTRAVEVPPGSVFLAGSDLTTLAVDSLRQRIATVTQRTEIYAGTLRENVALFDPTLLDRIEEAFAALDLLDWVADLPRGLDTPLGEGGEHLSAGEEQLVAFARVLVRSPSVVILDEATARMDPVTEARVERATHRLVQNRIGIVIAHRLSTVESCDEVVILSEGRVEEAGPLSSSTRFQSMLALAGPTTSAPEIRPLLRSRTRVAPPPTSPLPRTRTIWNIARLTLHEKRWGMAVMLLFTISTVFGLDGSVLGYLWGQVTTLHSPSPFLQVLFLLSLLVVVPANFYASRYFPQWWTHQILRLRTRVLFGQTGPSRQGAYTPGEVVALTNDTDRIINLADHTFDSVLCLGTSLMMILLSRSLLPTSLFALSLVLSACISLLVRHRLDRRAHATILSRNRFVSVLSSSLNGARTIRLSAATASVLSHLATLDEERTHHSVREVQTKTWATSGPLLTSGLLPILAWGLYLKGFLSPSAVLIATGALTSSQWFGWIMANYTASLPGARVWMQKAVGMSGTAYVSEGVPGVDLARGLAPAPPVVERRPLHTLSLRNFSAVHEDGTLGVGGVDLDISHGELVLVTGLMGSGKSSLLRALAGIVHHEGELLWNEEPVTTPEVFLRPAQVSYVAQLPRVVSGSFGENVSLDHPVDVSTALAAAQMTSDVTAAGGTGVLVGHKGTRLSGGQLQRLALARALAPETELLVADDVSSALDVTTEVAVWEALRSRGVTVVGSSFKRAALVLADRVVVLEDGQVAATGRWEDLEPRFGHLAG